MHSIASSFAVRSLCPLLRPGEFAQGEPVVLFPALFLFFFRVAGGRFLSRFRSGADDGDFFPRCEIERWPGLKDLTWFFLLFFLLEISMMEILLFSRVERRSAKMGCGFALVKCFAFASGCVPLFGLRSPKDAGCGDFWWPFSILRIAPLSNSLRALSASRMACDSILSSLLCWPVTSVFAFPFRNRYYSSNREGFRPFPFSRSRLPRAQNSHQGSGLPAYLLSRGRFLGQLPYAGFFSRRLPAQERVRLRLSSFPSFPFPLRGVVFSFLFFLFQCGELFSRAFHVIVFRFSTHYLPLLFLYFARW